MGRGEGAMKIPRETKEPTWTVNYKFIEEVQKQADQLGYVGMEEIENVILTLVTMGYLELEEP